MKRYETMAAVEKTFLTVAETCDLARISRTTLWRWIETGLLPARKVGRRVLIPKEEVDRLLSAKHVFSRGRASNPAWFENVNPEAAEYGAELIAQVLRASGLQVSPAGLQPILRGDELPTPIFWNALITGLGVLLRARTHGEEHRQTQELRSLIDEWIRLGRPGILWDPSTWNREPSLHNESTKP